MSATANKTHAGFDPAPAPAPVDAVAAAVYSTPAPFRLQLGDLARLSYLRATWRAALVLSAAAAGEVTIKLTDGATVFGTWTVNTATADRQHQSMEVALGAVPGATPLRVEMDVNTALPGGSTAQVFSDLILEHPLMVLGCGS